MAEYLFWRAGATGQGMAGRGGEGGRPIAGAWRNETG